jgi:hypothetical protein
VEARLIEPLFRALDRPQRRAYLSWDDIAALVLEDPLATVGSHGWSHRNLASLPAAEVAADVRRGHEAFVARLGRRPEHYAVPFGNVDQRLALDVTAALRALDYRSCLWVDDATNLVLGPRRCQLVHLVRLHAPLTAVGMERALHHLRTDPHLTLAQSIPPRSHSRQVTISPATGLDRVAPAESILRNEKDYALDPEHHAYLYTDNPYRGGPESFVVEEGTRVEAVIYAMPVPFTVLGAVVPGAYVGGWRKLPESHRYAAGLLLNRLVDGHPVLGVHDPNPEVGPAFARGWQAVAVDRHVIAVPTEAPAAPACTVSSHLEDDVVDLVDEAARQIDFGVARSRELLHWRYGRYRLAQVTYLTSASRWYAIVLESAGVVSISDWWGVSDDDVDEVVAAVVAWATPRGAVSVEVQTSRPAVSARLRDRWHPTTTRLTNHYRLDAPRLSVAGVAVDPLPDLCSLRLHETELCGDVLLR